MDAIKFHILLGAWARGQGNHKLARKHLVKAAATTKKFLAVRDDQQAKDFAAAVQELLTDKYMIKTFNKAARRVTA